METLQAYEEQAQKRDIRPLIVEPSDDYKNRRDYDAFDILSPDQAVLGICILIALAYIFRDFIK